MNFQKNSRSNNIPLLSSSSSSTFVESNEDVAAGKRKLDSDDEFTPQQKVAHVNAKKRKHKNDDKCSAEVPIANEKQQPVVPIGPPLKAKNSWKRSDHR